MATNLEQIVRELASFYDVSGKKLLVVGAGGGQLIDFARPARQVIAVDRDAEAMERLATVLEGDTLASKFTLVTCDILAVEEQADVVYLEFCLHQMSAPERVLDHAGTLAPEVLVIDHAPGSPWSWLAGEDRQVEAAWQAVERRAIRRQQSARGEQRFPDYAALAARLATPAPLVSERIGAFRDHAPIAIPMPYRLALL